MILPVQIQCETVSQKALNWKVKDTAACNEHGTIYAISSDFGDRMTTQSMGLMVLLSEHFYIPGMK